MPLASGLLTGKLKRDTQFSPEDHRSFNRNGEAFDKGETFSGVPYDTALDAVESLRKLVPAGMSMTQFEAVTCAIPGAKTAQQAADNAAAADLPPLSPETLDAVKAVYDHAIRQEVQAQW